MPPPRTPPGAACARTRPCTHSPKAARTTPPTPLIPLPPPPPLSFPPPTPPPTRPFFQAGDQRLTDTRQDEQDRCITIKSTGISLYYQMADEDLARFTGKRDGNDFLVNLIDSPGHVDFSSEVTAALRITDGALVVVDCVEGVCVQTETVLRQALGERIRPVMTVNKLDRCFLELMYDGEEAYTGFRRVIETANVIMATYADEKLGDTQVYPEKGTVSFSAGLHGWAFTLTVFSAIYAKRFGVEESKMMEKLWGDNFFDPATKKWTKKSTGAATCKRGFVQFVYEPIKTIIEGKREREKTGEERAAKTDASRGRGVAPFFLSFAFPPAARRAPPRPPLPITRAHTPAHPSSLPSSPPSPPPSSPLPSPPPKQRPSTTTRPSCLTCATSWASPPRSRRTTGSCRASP